jgi:hypothetical protein
LFPVCGLTADRGSFLMILALGRAFIVDAGRVGRLALRRIEGGDGSVGGEWPIGRAGGRAVTAGADFDATAGRDVAAQPAWSTTRWPRFVPAVAVVVATSTLVGSLIMMLFVDPHPRV